MRALFEVGSTYGWRHEELLALRVRQVNLLTGTIRLEPGTTKNDDGREVTMTQPVRELLTRCLEGKVLDDYVFTRNNGKPIRDFRRTWSEVCRAAGVPRLLFHDLRRTAVRNLRHSGVAEGAIMKIGGWKTRSVFERYAIVSQSDIADAMNKLQARRRENAAATKEQTELFGQALGRVSPENTGSPVPPSPSTMLVN
jgi:integrase